MVKHSLQILSTINLIPTLGKSELCIELLNSMVGLSPNLLLYPTSILCHILFVGSSRGETFQDCSRAKLLKVGRREDQRLLGRNAQPANLPWVQTLFPSSSLLLSPSLLFLCSLPTILLFLFAFSSFFSLSSFLSLFSRGVQGHSFIPANEYNESLRG